SSVPGSWRLLPFDEWVLMPFDRRITAQNMRRGGTDLLLRRGPVGPPAALRSLPADGFHRTDELSVEQLIGPFACAFDIAANDAVGQHIVTGRGRGRVRDAEDVERQQHQPEHRE